MFLSWPSDLQDPLNLILVAPDHIMTGRQNEYFIPGDGISREVIQADICRYLGNDALVRPGNHNVRLFVSPTLIRV